MGCGGDWWNVSNVHSAGGTRLNQYYTEHSCLHVCLDMLDNCVGVDIDARLQDEIRCWIHTDVRDFDETYSAVGITQYRLRIDCAQPCIYSNAGLLVTRCTYGRRQRRGKGEAAAP